MENRIAVNHFQLRIMILGGAASNQLNHYEYTTYDFCAFYAKCGTSVVKLISERNEAATKRDSPSELANSL